MKTTLSSGPWSRGAAVFQAMGPIEQIASIFSVPLEISIPIVRLFRLWILSSGEEWAVARMKDIYVNLIRYLAGEEPMYSFWTAVHSDGRPKGPLGGLFLWVSAKPTRKRRIHAVTLLRMYTRLRASAPTPKQTEKFLSGVLSTPTEVPSSLGNGIVEALIRVGCPRVSCGQPRPLLYAIPNPRKRHPMPDGRTYPETEHLALSRAYLSETPTGIRLREQYPAIFARVCEGTLYERSAAFGGSLWDVLPDSVGKIGLIQEPGFKLRAVANPGRVYQEALTPLGRALFQALTHLPWDCTFDQSKPMCVLQEHLSLGNTLHCVDLTGATDYFPLDLQIPAMNYVVPNGGEYVRLFVELSRAPWQFGSGSQAFAIRWTRGQPLGLLPSFAAFALTHGALLYHLNGYRHDNRFFVLGDDVVILDDSLAVKYKNVLATLGCPVSLNKTLDSNRLGEFAGKIIFPDLVVPQLKWLEPSDDSFVDWARNFGQPALRLLRPRQRKVVKTICDIPDFLGGLGWNPHGLPLEDRVAKYHRLFDRDEVAGSYLTDYNRLLMRASYEEPLSLPSKNVTITPYGDVARTKATFDQKVMSFTAQELPLLVEWSSIMGRNLRVVAPDLGLPLEAGQDTVRRTMLETLERKLG